MVQVVVGDMKYPQPGMDGSTVNGYHVVRLFSSSVRPFVRSFVRLFVRSFVFVVVVVTVRLFVVWLLSVVVCGRLLLVLLLKFALIYSVLEAELLLPLLLAPVIGRMSLPVLLLTTPYARTQGLGRWLVDYAPRRLVLGSLLILTGALSLVGGGWLMLSFATVAALLWVLRRLMILRIGGATGDTLGASLELSEATFLLLACSQIL